MIFIAPTIIFIINLLWSLFLLLFFPKINKKKHLKMKMKVSPKYLVKNEYSAIWYLKTRNLRSSEFKFDIFRNFALVFCLLMFGLSMLFWISYYGDNTRIKYYINIFYYLGIVHWIISLMNFCYILFYLCFDAIICSTVASKTRFIYFKLSNNFLYKKLFDNGDYAFPNIKTNYFTRENEIFYWRFIAQQQTPYDYNSTLNLFNEVLIMYKKRNDNFFLPVIENTIYEIHFKNRLKILKNFMNIWRLIMKSIWMNYIKISHKYNFTQNKKKKTKKIFSKIFNKNYYKLKNYVKIYFASSNSKSVHLIPFRTQ